MTEYEVQTAKDQRASTNAEPKNDQQAGAVGRDAAKNPFDFHGSEEDLEQLLGTKIWFRS